MTYIYPGAAPHELEFYRKTCKPGTVRQSQFKEAVDRYHIVGVKYQKLEQAIDNANHRVPSYI